MTGAPILYSNFPYLHMFVQLVPIVKKESYLLNQDHIFNLQLTKLKLMQN